MMSMVQGMVDYTKQPQFNNQKINNNGGFPFTSSGLTKQIDNSQSLINQNNGLASIGNGNQLQGSNSNQGGVNQQAPQRGSGILSQPILPSAENNRFTTSNPTQGTSGSSISSVPHTASGTDPFNQNRNFNNFNNPAAANNNQNNQQPTLFVSSLGEISSDPNLRFSPFTTALVSTRTFDTLPSNVDPVSTSAERFTSHGQFNQLNGNAQSKTPSDVGRNFNSDQFSPNNRITLQQEINHLSVGHANQPNSFQSQQPRDSSDSNDQTLSAVYSGSGDLLSHTISQYGNADQNAQQHGRNPHLSALVNSLGETILTPVFSGEGNLLSQTIGQTAPSKASNNVKTPQDSSASTSSVTAGKSSSLQS